MSLRLPIAGVAALAAEGRLLALQDGALVSVDLTGIAGLVGSATKIFTASGTLSLTTGDWARVTWIYIQAWGGGGGGLNLVGGGGGGGGMYVDRLFLKSALASTLSVTVGSGGTAGNGGQSSRVYSGSTDYIVALPGGAAGNPATGTHVGGNGAGGIYRGAVSGDQRWAMGGYAGGGGGAGEMGVAREGGSAVWGGAGGAANGYTPLYGGCVSQFGGNGAWSGSAATTPGGGGSGSSPGARGEVRVWGW